MKIVSFSEWFKLTESVTGASMVSDQIKDLIRQPDESIRKMAAEQLGACDPKDPFFKDWASYLSKLRYGMNEKFDWLEDLGKCVRGESKNFQATIDRLLLNVVYCCDEIFVFTTNKELRQHIIKSNISDGRFVRKFGFFQGDFDCSAQELTSLKNSPEKVEGNFWCYDNKLSSLAGSPRHVSGEFICSGNKLKSLEYGPTFVGGDYWCHENGLESMVGVPETIYGEFSCSKNSLTSLKNAPKVVRGDFWCQSNPLKSLEGGPNVVGGDYICGPHPGIFTVEDVRQSCNVSGKIKI